MPFCYAAMLTEIIKLSQVDMAVGCGWVEGSCDIQPRACQRMKREVVSMVINGRQCQCCFTQWRICANLATARACAPHITRRTTRARAQAPHTPTPTLTSTHTPAGCLCVPLLLRWLARVQVCVVRGGLEAGGWRPLEATRT